MNTPKCLPSTEYLRECFTYDRETGDLKWMARPRKHFATDQSCKRWNTIFAETAAGYTDQKGHRRITIDVSDYKAHRAIWKWMTGEEPPLEIDHRDGDYANNQWSNLRAATDGEQRWNSRFLSTNTSSRRGVGWNKKLNKWQVAICANGIRRHLGLFNSIEDASATYETAARKLHGDFYRNPQQR